MIFNSKYRTDGVLFSEKKTKQEIYSFIVENVTSRNLHSSDM